MSKLEAISTASRPDCLWQRVLVVDDDAFTRRSLSVQLRNLGVGLIREASCADAAVIHLSGPEPPELVVCDLQMEDGDGFQLLTDLARHCPTAGVLIVSATSNALRRSCGAFATSLDLNLIGTLEKPVRQQSLRTLLSDCDRRSCRAPQPREQLDLMSLRNALETREIQAFLQPQIEICSGRVIGAEALARWRRPDGRMVSPAEFVPLLEDAGLGEALTLSMLTQSLEFSLVRNGRMQISINVPMAVAESDGFLEAMTPLVRAYGVAPEKVTLEITETGVITRLGPLLRNTTRLRMAGFRLSLDDFGTGHGSIEQLHRIPFSELKVDRSFVGLACTQPEARSIVATSTSLAHEMGLLVGAEGAETPADQALLRQLGVDSMQGFLVQPALPAPSFEAWFRDNGGRWSLGASASESM